MIVVKDWVCCYHRTLQVANGRMDSSSLKAKDVVKAYVNIHNLFYIENI